MDIAGIQDILPALIEALSDAVVVFDRRQRIVAVNRRYHELFGESRPDLTGTACADGGHAAPSPGVTRCGACEAIADAAPRRLLRQVPDRGGAIHRYEATFSPILGADRVVTHVVAVWRDVTERGRLEVQLSHSERLASVGALAAGVAHEINNPLASMLAGVEGLERWLQRARFGPEDVAEAAETLGMLEREVARCRDTTDKLMLLGRSYDTAPSWVDLNQAVRDTLVLLRYEMRKRGITVVERLEEGMPHLWAREAGMRGICMNLMINAVQSMAEGGTLTVTSAHGHGHVRLAVEDTGAGIAPQHLARIWDPFFTTKPVGQGTGLGLSITQEIVTRHGGRIAVASEPGRGARFDVELPVQGSGGDV